MGALALIIPAMVILFTLGYPSMLCFYAGCLVVVFLATSTSDGQELQIEGQLARKRLERDERKARGERTPAEQTADDVLQRILPDGHKEKRR